MDEGGLAPRKIKQSTVIPPNMINPHTPQKILSTPMMSNIIVFWVYLILGLIYGGGEYF